MDANTSEWLNLFFRWIHVVAGILWIGLLYFFNFINGAVAATYDADSKKKIIPQLMPRTLYWFRWGAAYTWLSGILLLGIVYYMNLGLLLPEGSTLSMGSATGLGIGTLVVAFLIYDLLWKSPLGKNEKVGAVISFVLLVGLVCALLEVFTARAAFIHVGATLGTIMAGNVWMRIWPSQRKLIAAARDGTAADAAVANLAKLRSKHNTYMSVPLVYLMISNHFPLSFGHEYNEALLGGLILLAWVVVKLIYNKAGSTTPTKF